MKFNSQASSINEMDLILEKTSQKGELWLGNLKAAQNVKKLNEHNIKTVITVANNISLTFKQPFSHKIYRIEDTEKAQINAYFEEISKQIDIGLEKGSVLVHCLAGISRSSTCVIAYIMKSMEWSYEKTFYYVKERRLIINPNIGFKKQLVQYANKLKTEREVKTISPIKNLEIKNYWSHYQQLYKNKQRGQNINFLKNPELLLHQISTNSIKTPLKKISSLNRQSTPEEKYLYRYQLAEKLLKNTFSEKTSIQLNHNDKSEYQIYNKKDKPPIKVKAYLSMYKNIDMHILESDRVY